MGEPVRIVQIIMMPNGVTVTDGVVAVQDPKLLGLDNFGRLWQTEGFSSDRASRPMLEWHPIRALFHERALIDES